MAKCIPAKRVQCFTVNIVYDYICFWGRALTVKFGDRIAYLNGFIFAPQGGNLNKPIFKGSIAREGNVDVSNSKMSPAKTYPGYQRVFLARGGNTLSAEGRTHERRSAGPKQRLDRNRKPRMTNYIQPATVTVINT